MKTIQEIIDEQNTIKITNQYKDEDLAGIGLLYNATAHMLNSYGKKRGSNLTPKKKKRKK